MTGEQEIDAPPGDPQSHDNSRARNQRDCAPYKCEKRPVLLQFGSVEFWRSCAQECSREPQFWCQAE